MRPTESLVRSTEVPAAMRAVIRRALAARPFALIQWVNGPAGVCGAGHRTGSRVVITSRPVFRLISAAISLAAARSSSESRS